MVKCQQRLEFMRIYRISFHMSLYQLIPAVKENRKRNCANAKCKIYGQRYFPLSWKPERGLPWYQSDPYGQRTLPARTYLFHAKRWVHHHFVLDGTGFYSAGGQTWSLTPGQMFVIYPNEPVTYGADETNPWTYAWIGFRGIRAHSMVKECGFSKIN